MPPDIRLPPPSLTPWAMFMSADHVVQAVIILLLIASVVTWTTLLAKGGELLSARRRLATSLSMINAAPSLASVAKGLGIASARPLVAAAEAEMQASTDLPADGITERVALRLRRIELGLGRRMARGTGVLASIGSCAPFVGLLGTVWGIMNSFVGISRMQTTSLAVVAPGIAEALLATACGLVAAIPAVLVYNLFARAIAGYRADLGDLSAGVQVLVSRELDRAVRGPQEAAEPARSVLIRRAAE